MKGLLYSCLLIVCLPSGSRTSNWHLETIYTLCWNHMYNCDSYAPINSGTQSPVDGDSRNAVSQEFFFFFLFSAGMWSHKYETSRIDGEANYQRPPLHNNLPRGKGQKLTSNPLRVLTVHLLQVTSFPRSPNTLAKNSLFRCSAFSPQLILFVFL